MSDVSQTKKLAPFLLDERNRLMKEMRKKGHSLQNIADVFSVSKPLVHQIVGPEETTSEKVEENKKESK